MDNYKLKVRVADHEFDGEGARDDVNERFKDFKELVALALSQPAHRNAPTDYEPPPGSQSLLELARRAATPAPREGTATDAALGKIMKVDNRVISLTIRPRSAEDAVLLMLYGQKILRDNDSVTGAEVIMGLATTGGLQVGRVDRLLEKAGGDGDVIVIGERRGKRYRLTNTGIAKARALAADLIATVA